MKLDRQKRSRSDSRGDLSWGREWVLYIGSGRYRIIRLNETAEGFQRVVQPFKAQD